MQSRSDSTVFENKAVQEMLETEQSYNRVLDTLVTALTIDVQVKDEPILLEIKKIAPMLKNVSDGLLTNAQSTAAPDLQSAERELLNKQRTQLLSAFFKIYEQYIQTFDRFLEARQQYAVQFASNPTDNPFNKIDRYLMRHGNNLGLDAHLIQPLQRGPRYSMLVTEAIKQAIRESEKTGVPHETDNFRELERLQRFIADKLFDINAAKAEGYWFGKITYTLLFGEPGKTPVQPTRSPSPEPDPSPTVEKPRYRFGDLTRYYLLGGSKADQSQAASSVPVTPEVKAEQSHSDDDENVNKPGNTST